MARKSNKTAHVLNLLAGQDTNEEPEKEPQKEPAGETSGAPAEPSAPAAPASGTDAAPAPAPSPQAQPEVPPHISIIDNGSPEEDPVAEQIRAELLKNLEPEEEKVPEPETAKEKPAEPEKAAEPEPLAKEPEEAKPAKPEPVTEKPAEEKPAEPEITQPAAPPVEKSPEPPAAPAEKPAAAETVPEKAEEPEPDYCMVNVMERIVQDKIIYFMKQFEVCTCDRCKTDTIALTLNGLPAKYMVMDKAAVDPMISFLTGRLISQVTVEAVKACTQVKEHPRHKEED